MPNPIYKPTKPYTEDINDLIEKGGVGSGKRGHKTNKPSGINMNSAMAKWAEPEVARAMNKLILADMNGTAPSDKACQSIADKMGQGMTASKVKERILKISSAQQNKTYEGP